MYTNQTTSEQQDRGIIQYIFLSHSLGSQIMLPL